MRVLLALGLAFVATVHAGETITISGVTHRNAEMADLCREGLIYRLEDGAFATLPWESVSSAQLSAVRSKLPEGLSNALYGAHYVKGTVFEVRSEGVVVQVDLGESGKGPGYREGAVVLSSGLALVRGLPASVPQGEGAPVEVVAHKVGTFTYTLGGLAAKEIPLLTVAKPAWAVEQEWKNLDGQVMHARLVAVKEDKGLFEKNGQRFVYELDKLDEEARRRAADIGEKLKGFPLP